MAEKGNEKDSNDDNETSDESVLGGGKKKIILFALAGVLVVLACVGGTLFLLGFFDSGVEPEAVPAAEVAAQPVVNKPPPAMYFPVKPAFVVNFQSKGRQRYLQTDVTIMTRNPDVFTALQMHLPLIKNRLVMLFSGAVYEELQTDEGRELMRQQALETVKEVMQQEIGKADIEQILFTNFVMQ